MPPQLIGLPTRRIVFTAFVLSGALSGLAGFMSLARFGNITVEAGRGLELQVVAAVVVGGVNIFGGSGTVFGAMLGADHDRHARAEPVPAQISEFWRDALARPADPAGGGQRRGHPAAAARSSGRAPSSSWSPRPTPNGSREEARAMNALARLQALGRRCCSSSSSAIVAFNVVRLAVLSRRRQHRQPVPALDREDHRRADR